MAAADTDSSESSEAYSGAAEKKMFQNGVKREHRGSGGSGGDGGDENVKREVKSESARGNADPEGSEHKSPFKVRGERFYILSLV
jgi:hypothetical protein